MAVFGKEKFDWAFNYPNTRFQCRFLVGHIAQPRMHTCLDKIKAGYLMK